MNQEYSLGGDLVTVGSNSLDEMVRGTIGAHYNIALAAIVVLAIVVIVLLFKKEGYNPTRTAKMQAVSLSGSEAMSVGTIDQAQLDCTQKPIGDDAWGWMYGQLGNSGLDPVAMGQGKTGGYQQADELFTNPQKVTDAKLSAIASGY